MTYTTPQVCEMTGVSYRMLDYWSRVGIINAERGEANGSGSKRLWSARQIPQVRLVAKLREMGAGSDVATTVIGFMCGVNEAEWVGTYLVVASDGRCELTNTVLPNFDAAWLIALDSCLFPARVLDLVSV